MKIRGPCQGPENGTKWKINQMTRPAFPINYFALGFPRSLLSQFFNLRVFFNLLIENFNYIYLLVCTRLRVTVPS